MSRIIALVLTIGFLGCGRARTVKSGLEGKAMPTFNFLKMDSSSVNSTSIPNGEPIVLFYFSPSCPYCRAQIQDIEDNITKFKNCRFYLLSLSSISELKDFYAMYHLDDYPNVVVGVDNFFQVGNYFKIHSVPFNAIYSGKRILTGVIPGKAEISDFEKLVLE